jgi:hypothetical protein
MSGTAGKSFSPPRAVGTAIEKSNPPRDAGSRLKGGRANIGYMARHILPEEAVQVILNDPVDLGMEIVEGKERYLNSARRPGARCNGV